MLTPSSKPSLLRLLLTVFFASSVLASSPPSYGYGSGSGSGKGKQDTLWSGWGGGILNTRWAKTNTYYNSKTIDNVEYDCKILYDFGVSATPTIGKNDMVYYPSWNGSLVALNYKTCKVKWEFNVTKFILDFKPYTIDNTELSSVSRTSPVINDGVLYWGTQLNGLVVASDLETGKVLDYVQLNPNQYTIITMSPTWYNGKLLIGASSGEELSSTVAPNFKCCSFVGNMVALSFKGGKFKTEWNTTMIPDSQVSLGWKGAGLWGSQPMIDVKRNQVILGTSNSYSTPEVIQDCLQETANITAFNDPSIPPPCLPRNVLQDAVIALDLDHGTINWINQLYPVDAWVAACGVKGVTQQNPIICPDKITGDNAGFGMNPSFIPGSKNTPNGEDVVVVGQKSGRVHSLSAQTGYLHWSVYTSPNGVTGGLSWGIAVDDSRVYFTLINSQSGTYQLMPQNVTTNGSAWGAVSLKDGTSLWGTELPASQGAYGPPTVVGDIVLVGQGGIHIPAQLDPRSNGSLIALDKSTGKVISNKPVVGVFHGGIAIQDEYVLFGTGYSKLVVPGFENITSRGYIYVGKV